MLEIVASRLEEIQGACRALCVRRLDLFGSAADGTFDPNRSDLDFLVEFEPCSPAEHYERYFGLREFLENLFGRSIDLVERRAMRNPYVLRRATDAAVSLYAA